MDTETTDRSKAVLGVTCAASFVALLDLTVVNIAFPNMAEDFSETDLSTLSWVLNAYAIVFAALLVPAGRLGDRYGRRKIFLSGMAVFTLASALCAVAPSPWFLVGARVLQAIGGALLVPTSLALLLPAFPPQRRASAVAMWGGSAVIASALGPTLGGFLVDVASWRWVFLFNLPLGLYTVLRGKKVLSEYRDQQGGARPDVLGILGFSIGIAALAFGIVKAGPDWGWTDTGTLVSFAVAAVLVAAVLARSARHQSPVLDVRLFGVRSFAAANTASLIFGMAFYATLLGNILFLTGVWGWSPIKAGLAITPGPIAATLVALPAGRLADRFGARAVVLPAVLIYALAGYLWYRNMGVEVDYAADFLPGMILAGIGSGVGLSILTSAATAALPPLQFATSTAVVTMARQIGAVLGIAILVAIVGTPGPADVLDVFRDAWLFIAIASLASAVAVLPISKGHAAPAPTVPAPTKAAA